MDVTFIEKGTVHVVFAVWLVTRGLALTKAATPHDCLAYYRRKFQTVSIDNRQFGREIGRDALKKYLDKTSEHRYFALPAADAMIEELLTQQGIQKPYRET